MAKLEATQYHTYNGVEYQIGDVYEGDDAYAANVCAQGKAKCIDVPQEQPRQTKDASTAVEPMTSADFLTRKA